MTDDPKVNALILDEPTIGELYGEDWEVYRMYADSDPTFFTDDELDCLDEVLTDLS